MHVGMLYYDNDPKTTPSAKIEGAANYYEAKYGTRPNLCYVHPSMNVTGSVDGIEVKKSHRIMPNHLWIGVD